MLTISPDRIARDLDAIAACSECDAATGHSRPTFSPAWAQARDYLLDELRRANCKTRTDAAGNLHARPAALDWQTPAFLSGSHIDSVPTGGKFDGVVGVACPLEILRAANDADATVPLELIVFAEEEGTTFNLGMLGSRAWTGSLSADQLAALKNKHGQSYLDAGCAHGVNPAQLTADRFSPAPYRGLIEVHVEQGLALWTSDTPVALVTAINGRRQFAVTVTGQPNHAGSTKMAHRQDALAAAAEMIGALELLAHNLDKQLDHTVITVGRLTVEPNALNVIAGTVHFFIDLRARSDAMLAEADDALRERIAHIAHRREVSAAIQRTESLPAMPMDAGLCGRLRAAAAALHVPLPDAASGALHDAAILAPLLPTAMLFIASKDGISHNPAEFSRLDDIALATRILAAAVTA
jgi:hydantoinase/carbamoylase family amidase